MADDELVLRASVQDEMSGPLDRIAAAERRVGQEADRAGRQAGSAGAQGLSRFEAAGRRLHAQLGRVDQGLRTLSRRAGQELVTGLRRGATALGVMGGAAALFGVKSASNFQASNIAFETLLGSAERGKALFGELQKLNLRTPFELRDLTTGAQMLLRYNVPAEKLLGLLKGMTDAAALTTEPTENLNAMARAIGQIVSTGRLTGQDALQLVQAGINAYDIYAKKLGITQAQARKLGEEGKLSADILIDAVTNLDSGLEKFRGGAEKMSRTLLGQWSNLKDALNVGLAGAASPLVDELSRQIGTPDNPGPLVGGLSSLINTVGPPFFRLLGSIVAGVGRLLPVVEPLLTTLAAGLERILTAGNTAGNRSLLDRLATDLGDALVELIDALVEAMPDLVPAFIAFVEVLPDAIRLLAGLVTVARPLVRLATGLMGFAPVRGVMAGLLVALLGYRQLRGVVGGMIGFARALGMIRAAEASQGATGAVGAAGGAAGGAGRFLGPAAGILGGGAAVYSAGQDKKHTVGTDLKLIGGTAAIGAGLGLIGGPLAPISVPVGAAIGAGAGALVALGTRLWGDRTPPRRLNSTLAHDAGVEAGTPGSRALTSSYRTFGVTGAGSGHVAGTAVDRSGPFMARYVANVRGAGGWATLEGNHAHADYGDATPPTRRRGIPTAHAAGISGDRTLVIQGHVYGVDDLEALWRSWNRRLDAEDTRRHRAPQGAVR